MRKIKFKLDPITGTLSEGDSKRYFSTLGWAVFALMVLGYATAFALMTVADKFFPQLMENDVFSYGVSFVSQYSIAFIVFVLILWRLPKDTSATESMGFKSWMAGLCVACTFMTVGNSVGQFVIGILEGVFSKTIQNPIAESTTGTHWLVNLVFIAILAPIIEELIFRKILCDRLLPLGEGYAVVLSSVIFGLAHGNLYQFFYAFLTGILFSAVYVKTGRIRYSMIYHMIINFFGGVVVPYIYNKLTPILNEEMIERMMEVLQSDDLAAMEALSVELIPYMIPVTIYWVYQVAFTVASVFGVIIIFKNRRKFRLCAGLLPPAKEGRVSNILLNSGVAAAIAAFVGMFILSLL